MKSLVQAEAVQVHHVLYTQEYTPASHAWLFTTAQVSRQQVPTFSVLPHHHHSSMQYRHMTKRNSTHLLYTGRPKQCQRLRGQGPLNNHSPTQACYFYRRSMLINMVVLFLWIHTYIPSKPCLMDACSINYTVTFCCSHQVQQ